MRTSAFLAALLATVVSVAATPGGNGWCTKTVHKWKVTKTATSTTYPSTVTQISTVSAGTSTSIITTTSTPTSTVSCISPSFSASKRDAPDYKNPHGNHCWHTKTVTATWGTTTTTSTVTRVSTVRTTSMATATTVTSTSTATATSTVISAGTFNIIDANQEVAGFAVADEQVFESSLLSTFNFTDGVLTVVSGSSEITGAVAAGGDGIYTDPNLLYDGAETNSLYGLQPSDAATQGATAISCTFVQRVDGTCPLTCTGNGGSQFYGCSDAEGGILIGPEGGTCDTESAYDPIIPFIVNAV